MLCVVAKTYPEVCMSTTKNKTPFEMSSHFILNLSVKSNYLKFLRGIQSTTDSCFDLIPLSLSIWQVSDELLNVLKQRIQKRKLFACRFLQGFLTHQRRAQHNFALGLETARMTSNVQVIRQVLTVCALCSVRSTTA